MRCWRRPGLLSGGARAAVRVGIYFVLALGLFPALGYANVWAKLTAALDSLPLPCPSAKGLRDLRRRLGPAPLKALVEVLAGPTAQSATPGTRFGPGRTAGPAEAAR